MRVDNHLSGRAAYLAGHSYLTCTCCAVDLTRSVTESMKIVYKALKVLLLKSELNLDLMDNTNELTVLALGGIFVMHNEMSYGGLLAFVTVNKVL